MSKITKSKIIRVRIEEGKEGLFYATSPELKGLLVAEADLEALEKSIPRAIAELFEVCGVTAIVTKAEENDGDFHPWVAVPAELAQAALQERH